MSLNQEGINLVGIIIAIGLIVGVGILIGGILFIMYLAENGTLLRIALQLPEGITDQGLGCIIMLIILGGIFLCGAYKNRIWRKK